LHREWIVKDAAHPLTLLELLESLEAAVAARQSGADPAAASSSLVRQTNLPGEVHWTFSDENASALPPGVLRSQMARAGLTEAEFSAIFGLTPGLLQDWLEGIRPVPSWVLPTIQMLYLLSPAVRQRLLQDMPLQQSRRPEAQRKQIKSHPFSRIEDL
jgi:hypothetical protein